MTRGPSGSAVRSNIGTPCYRGSADRLRLVGQDRAAAVSVAVARLHLGRRAGRGCVPPRGRVGGGGWLGMAGSGCLPGRHVGEAGRAAATSRQAGESCLWATPAAGGSPGREVFPLRGRDCHAYSRGGPLQRWRQWSRRDWPVGRETAHGQARVGGLRPAGRASRSRGALGRWWLPLYGTSSRFVNAAVMRAHSPGRRVDAIGEIVETGPLSGRPLTGDAVTGLERVARGG